MIAVAFALAAPMVGAAAQPAAPPASIPVDPAIADAIAEVKTDASYQFRISPSPPPQPPSAFGRWLESLFDWLGGEARPVVRVIGWLLIGALALFLLYLFVPVVRETVDNALARLRQRKGLTVAGDQDWQPDSAAARNLLAEADALAAAGRFDEAAQLLLTRSLEEISARHPGLLKPALTARAIAAIDALPDLARTAFGRIAEAVERSRWARRALAEPDWQSARAAYEDFAFGGHWRARAA